MSRSRKVTGIATTRRTNKNGPDGPPIKKALGGLLSTATHGRLRRPVPAAEPAGSRILPKGGSQRNLFCTLNLYRQVGCRMPSCAHAGRRPVSTGETVHPGEDLRG